MHRENRFLAGVAAFNLGRFSQAASYWRRLPRPEWRFADLYVVVADGKKSPLGPLWEGFGARPWSSWDEPWPKNAVTRSR